MMRMKVLGLLALGILMGCGEPQSSEKNQVDKVQSVLGTVTGAIKGGYTDENTTGVLGMIHQSNYGVSSCTGSLIAPNVVLTAQHCIAPIQGSDQGVDCGSSGFGNVYPASSLFVTPNTFMGWNSFDYTGAAEVHVPSGGYGNQWGEDSLVCGNDVAILVLSKPIDSASAKLMIPRVDIPLQKNEEYSAVGYGATNQAGDGSGTRRRRDNLSTECIGGDCPYYYSYSVKDAEWVGDTGVCQGDSGGPAVDSINRVVGVASRGGNNCSSPVYGYVYAWGDWIKEQTVLATQKAGVVTPKWALGWPTDPKFSFEIAGNCEVGTDCISGICEGGVCSRSCAAEAPCPDGFACLGTPAVCQPAPVGDLCETDEECLYGPCEFGACTRACTNVFLDCPEGYVCDEGICMLYPVGYPCAGAEDCYSGVCSEDGYCTRVCGENAPCPESYYCNPDGNLCSLMPVGHDCEDGSDCWSAICGADGLCTRPCSDEVLCPGGYSCVGGVCELLPVGHPCESPEDCFSGVCGSQGFCTRVCGDEAPCPGDYVCTENGICEEPTVGLQVCEEGIDCPSGWCLNNYCTRPCNADSPCPEGTECREDLGLCEAPPELLIEGGVAQTLEASGYETGLFAEAGEAEGCSTGSPMRLPLMGVSLFGLVLWSRRREPQVARITRRS